MYRDPPFPVYRILAVSVCFVSPVEYISLTHSFPCEMLRYLSWFAIFFVPKCSPVDQCLCSVFRGIFVVNNLFFSIVSFLKSFRFLLQLFRERLSGKSFKLVLVPCQQAFWEKNLRKIRFKDEAWWDRCRDVATIFRWVGEGWGRVILWQNISRCRSSEKRELNFNQIKNFQYLSSLPWK